MCGFWEGIAKDNRLECDDVLYDTQDGNLYPSPYNGEAFYRKWYEYLKNEGISFVKVDGQSTVPFFFKNEIPYPASMAGIMKGIESASEIFHHDVINCMGMAMESINARKITGVSRNSNDFVPTFGEEGFKELAAKFRAVASIEKRHEDRYRSLLNDEDSKAELAKSSVKVWECLKCGHIVTGPNAPEYCPTCGEYNQYFEVREDNYDLILTWGR